MAALGEWNQARLAAGVAGLEAATADVAGGTRTGPSLALAGYAGSYADNWYGPIAITHGGTGFRIDFRQSPGMAGALEHHRYDTFVARWDDAPIEPAYVPFNLDEQGEVARITTKAVSPVADFSCDYQDLLFTPAPDKAP